MGRAMDRKTIVLVLLLLWYVSFSTDLYVNCVSPNVLRIQKEKEALLTFRKHVKDPSNRLSSWTGNECCTWKGIGCDNLGHVIKLSLPNPCTGFESKSLGGFINDSFKELNYLQYLDLSFNKFEDNYIPSFLGSLGKLEYLSLSHAGFNMRADNLKWLSNLTFLKVLDMSAINLSWVPNSFKMTFGSLVTLDLSLTSVSVQVAFHIPTLKNLDLSLNSFTTIPNWLCNITSLERLDLSTNNIAHVLLGDIDCLSHLKHLDLSWNKVEGKFPISLWNLCNLTYLDFSHNNLEGELDELLGNSSACGVKTLEYLDLSHNSLSGALPDQLRKLQKLSILRLLYNSFSGLIPMSISNLSSLRVLDASYNKLTGNVPTSIGNLSSLREYHMSSNQLNGTIPTSIGKLSSLRILDVSANQLNGAIPTSLGDLWNLEVLYIGGNKLEGSILELPFSNLTRLKIFSAYSNQLNLTLQSDWVPPFQLKVLDIGSCQVGPRFPTWIESQKDLQNLDLSNSSISDVIPSWLWGRCSQFIYLSLSQNQIHGNIPNLTCGVGVYLGSNNFSGPLPHFSPTIQVLDLSNNSFHGFLSPVFCEERDRMSDLKILDLSGNLLYGELPDCWMNYSKLVVLHLGDNNLIGNIPSSLGTLVWLSSLSLYKNNLSGNFPRFLGNSTWLDFLDLSENNLSSNLSIWLENSSPLLQFRFILLRSNNFGGNIPRELCHIHSLQILDLAQNNFIGNIPRCFGNFSGMMEEPLFSSPITEERAFLITKRKKYEYRRLLKNVTAMDLSSNSLTGEIPEELTNLYWLRFWNLSNNYLIGNIPKRFDGMKQLESLDVSCNQLTGVIPQSMADLSFLSNLNLSYNDLFGRIPTSTQFQSFSKFDFIGNDDLCGPPLTTTCPGDDTSLEPLSSVNKGGGEDGGWMDKRWFYMGILYGFVVGFWGVFGPLAFNKAWRYEYYKFWNDARYQLFGGI